MPEVSIIMPVYNIEEYLPRCLDSIINQTYFDFELLAVDDGSKDKSLNILQKYATEDSRIKVFHQENAGASRARNNGLDHASGEYISFIDGDDFIDPHYIEKLYWAIKEENTMLSMCGLECVDVLGNVVESHFSNNYVPEQITGREAVCQIGRNVTFGVVWNKLYNRKLFDDIRFTEGMTFEDEMILHHIYGKVDKISCVRQNLYYYVQRPGSKMRESYSPAKMDIIVSYIDRIRFLLEEQYPEKEILRVNIKLIDYFRTAIVKGRKSKIGKEKYRRLHQEYCLEVYPYLPPCCKTFSTRFFINFPILYGYVKTINNKLFKVGKI